MLEGIMITIRFTDKTTTPPTEWVETLPEDTKVIVSLGIGYENTFLEKIEVNGQPFYMQRGFNADTILRVLFRLLRRPVGVSEG
jgi:hypothetical protein